jgi:hypothetical protein
MPAEPLSLLEAAMADGIRSDRGNDYRADL